MLKKVAPYIGEYKKYMVWAAVMMSLGILYSDKSRCDSLM